MTRDVCCQHAGSLNAFVDGELEPSQAIAFQQHVDACEACAERVAFARASRASVRNSVKTVKAPDAFRMRMTAVVAEASAARYTGDVMTGSRLLSWRIAGPMAAAAALALVAASISKLQDSGSTDRPTLPTASASRAAMVPVETLVDTLVDQHANPLPPEATSPTEIAKFDRFIGVRARDIPEQALQGRGHLLGARMVPLHKQRAAMFQYVMGNGSRVSLYVYDPNKVRLASYPSFHERVVVSGSEARNEPVYVGYVRGYSVAVTDRHGVGYAMASDLDENESSKLILAVGTQ